jgi:triosephosphate isomerase (TIM)
MKKLFIVANWKANKTQSEAAEWIEKVQAVQFTVAEVENKEIIICPAYPLLTLVSDFISGSEASNKLLLRLGSQNLSQFEKGAYTGEVPINLLQEFCAYSIIGHSERRKYFNETDDDVMTKVKLAIENKITPILCISDMNQLDYYITHDKFIVDNAADIIFVYEPPSAISGGGDYHPESPEVVNKNVADISQKIGKKVITLYGGSINPENVKSFFQLDNIDGGLVGQASLDPEQFIQIIKNA